MKPTVISTFAGCGGSSLGYQMAGFHELLAVEWDQNAVDTFRLNFVPPNLMKAIAEHIKINILQRMKDAFPEIEIKRLND